MNGKQLKHLFALTAILLIAACQTTAVDKPSPAPAPAATPLPAPASMPAPAKDPVSGAPSTTASTGSPASTDKDKADKDKKTGDSTTDSAGGDPQTSEERRVAVAKSLDDSLGTWDETLRKEQSDLAKQREQRAEDTAKTAQKNGEGVEDVDADAGVDPEKARNGDMKSDADAKKDPNGASSDNGAGHQGDVGEGRVDDIVGRQICEAARNETDPELKAKLQKECQKYRDASH